MALLAHCSESYHTKSNRYNCMVCSEVFTLRKSLFEHLCKVHEYKAGNSSISDDKYKVCELCNMVFRNIKEHKKTIHGITVEKKGNTQGLCSDCGVLFSSENVLKKHQQRKHPNINNGDDISNRSLKLHKSRIKCPECKIDTLKTYKNLINHLGCEHKIEVSYEELNFNSFEEFEKWKTEYEDTHYVLYSKDCSPKPFNKTGKKFVYYNCHRSYAYRGPTNSKKMQKLMGSNKIAYACPSHMKVIINIENKCTIHFWKTHVGHTTDLQRCKLRNDVRAEIAGKIQMGYSVQNILDETRNSLVKDRVVNRKHLLTKKDIYNISRDFNINYIRNHDVNNEHLADWVKNLHQQTESPFIYFKNVGDNTEPLLKNDFALVLIVQSQIPQLQKFGSKVICVDFISYSLACEFNLYILMTVDDEFELACAVAFCFSNRADSIIFKLFFDQIKNFLGEIKTSVFISNHNLFIYKSWCSVMLNAPQYFWTDWDVLEDWKLQTEALINDKPKREWAENMLKALQSTHDKDAFEGMLTEVLNELSKDSCFADFSEYFVNCYVSSTEFWGPVFRNSLIINTTSHLHSLHKVFKKSCLRLSKQKQLVKVIESVLKTARDFSFQQIVKVSTTKQSSKIMTKQSSNTQTDSEEHKDIEETTKEIQEKMLKTLDRHNKSAAITERMIVGHENKNEWTVYSFEHGEITNTVVKLNVLCNDCSIRCNKCNICIHTCQCSCSDYINNSNICIHIHACIRKTEQSLLQTTAASDTNEYDTEIINTCDSDIFEIMYAKDEDEPQTLFLDELKHKTDLILALSDHVTLSKEEEISVLSKMDQIVHAFHQKLC